MDDDTVIGCLDAKRQEEFFSGLFDLYIPAQSANQEELLLPPYIPLITNAIPKVPDFNSNPIYAISMETLLNDRGDLCIRSREHLLKKWASLQGLALHYSSIRLNATKEKEWF